MLHASSHAFVVDGDDGFFGAAFCDAERGFAIRRFLIFRLHILNARKVMNILYGFKRPFHSCLELYIVVSHAPRRAV